MVESSHEYELYTFMNFNKSSKHENKTGIQRKQHG